MGSILTKNMKNIICQLSSFILAVSSVPHWEDLQCEDGHKYLFSELSLSWDEAVGECSLYAGWLVSLNSLQEQNCLLKHAQAQGLTEDWYWTDATDTDAEGVFVHTATETEVTWLNTRWGC